MPLQLEQRNLSHPNNRLVLNELWERPLLTSDLRVGRGVRNEPPKFDVIGYKLSHMVGRSKTIKNCRTSFMVVPFAGVHWQASRNVSIKRWSSKFLIIHEIDQIFFLIVYLVSLVNYYLCSLFWKPVLLFLKLQIIKK